MCNYIKYHTKNLIEAVNDCEHCWDRFPLPYDNIFKKILLILTLKAEKKKRNLHPF